MIQRTLGLTRRQLGSHLVWFLIWVCVTGVALFLTPNPNGHGTHQQLGLPPCPSVLVFGRPCPGCGLTTSFTSMVHGQFTHAVQANPFGPILYLAFTISALVCLYGYVRGIKFDIGTRSGTWALGCLLTAYMVFGIVRFYVTDPNQYVGKYWGIPGLSTNTPQTTKKAATTEDPPQPKKTP
ncbi:MAG: DUF2752 domain-containing protein [Fimbriimonadaceae bacterium]|nr:DUF2752 domain-containing protein [Fimbriimonadaceae bacterium]